MPIIAQIGRRSPKVRALIVFIYFVLAVGSVTTFYPFLMMLGSSVTSLADFREYRVVPRFTYDDRALFVKYLQDKYRTEQFDQVKLRYHIEEPFEQIVDGEKIYRKYGQFAQMERLFSDVSIPAEPARRRVSDWSDFTASLPMKYKDTFYHYAGIYIGEVQTGFQDFLKKKYGSLDDINKAYGDVLDNFLQVDAPYEAYDRHSWFPSVDPRTRDWDQYRRTLPPRLLNVMMIRPIYEVFLLNSYPSIADLNAAWGSSYKYLWEIPFPLAKPSGPAAEKWEQFVRKKIPLRFVRLDVENARPSYVEFLRGKYETVEAYNGLLGDTAASLDAAPLSEFMPASSLALDNWQKFYEEKCPLGAIVLDVPDVRYAAFLQEKYGDPSSMNAACGTSFASFADAEPPYRETDFSDLTTRRFGVLSNFLTRNYSYVVKRVFLQGRPLLNTFLLVLLIVGTAVTVNPLAAYALSRYRLSYGAGVLVFMLATMAFPAEVAMIPSFLMIKEFGLLNTFAALVLPGLASGYSIFLLKGFFDSLPQELYEAATIDGAGEFRMFWVITMPLSLPILSVIALFAFSGAYGSFIWAFTVCQDSRMWTLMVFLQQFQTDTQTHPYLVMASLVVAAIPTIVVFLSAQKVLMRGIVIPTMK
jgi:multiple sugar transport system permease protein